MIGAAVGARQRTQETCSLPHSITPIIVVHHIIMIVIIFLYYYVIDPRQI